MTFRPNRPQDIKRCRAIVEIRARARLLTVEEYLQQLCPMCDRPKDAPYRGYKAYGPGAYGTGVIQGCVDAHHEGALEGESLRWHVRPEAQELRFREFQDLGLGDRKAGRSKRK